MIRLLDTGGEFVTNPKFGFRPVNSRHFRPFCVVSVELMEFRGFP